MADDEHLREWAESDDHLRWVVAHHTAPEGKDYCSDCSERFPCDMVSLAATGLTRSADLAAERQRSERMREAGDDVALQLSNWVEDHPQYTWCYSKAALAAWRALAADDARRDGQEE